MVVPEYVRTQTYLLLQSGGGGGGGDTGGRGRNGGAGGDGGEGGGEGGEGGGEGDGGGGDGGGGEGGGEGDSVRKHTFQFHWFVLTLKLVQSFPLVQAAPGETLSPQCCIWYPGHVGSALHLLAKLASP